MRNLMTEFKLDKRMSPLVPGKGGLGDDWAYTTKVSGIDARRHGIALEMSNIRIIIEMDGAYQSGRIVSLEFTSVKSRPRKELFRGVSLGEAWDFCKNVSGDQIAEISSIYFQNHVMNQSQWDAEQARVRKIREDIEENDRIEAQRIASSGRVVTKNGVLVYVSDVAIANSLRIAAEKELRAAVKKYLRSTDEDMSPLIELAISHGMATLLQKMLQEEINNAKHLLKEIKRAK